MPFSINETHDPKLKSWVESANDPTTDFPIQNLPLGLFNLLGSDELPSIGVAIGDQVLNINDVAEELWEDDFEDMIADACSVESLDFLMLLEPELQSEFRRRVSRLLRADNHSDERYLIEDFLLPMDEVELLVPTEIGDFTDFYASLSHATNIGKMFRPEQPLLPNYKWVPLAYHGRSSSIVISGTPVNRPCGQTRGDDEDGPPVYGACKALDYELEVGFFVGYGNDQGQPLRISEAEDHIFGLCLVNDWSARDIQRWEYQPLGPFLAKSFATTISPWIVMREALAPFRVPALIRPEGDPEPLPYLDSIQNRNRGGFDIKLEVHLSTERMREKKIEPHRLSTSNTKDLYWTFAQMLTHHSSNGCNLRPSDLIASGTVSGATKDSSGCLLELTSRGKEPIQLPSGEMRKFLEDGDEVIFRAYCEREGFRRIGFGECRGIIVTAVDNG
ncbi:MAG: fumarylacetoacetase [Blastocatellia bacterium]|nr:fumarylacetoacetase [Blastocatellia bacterium]